MREVGQCLKMWLSFCQTSCQDYTMHSAEVKDKALSLSQSKYLSLKCVYSKGSRVCKKSICRRVFERLEGMQEIDILNAADQGAFDGGVAHR
jgi:hypothetical protein